LLQETFVQIKELQEESIEIQDYKKKMPRKLHLRDVASKTDFGSRICQAQIFGAPRKPVAKSFKAETTTTPAELEHSETASLKVPPHVLVLTLASGYLLFVIANHQRDGTVKFMSCSKPIPNGLSLSETVGKHIAVDPRLDSAPSFRYAAKHAPLPSVLN
jgi:hypothetical protein